MGYAYIQYYATAEDGAENMCLYSGCRGAIGLALYYLGHGGLSLTRGGRFKLYVSNYTLVTSYCVDFL